MGRGALKIVFSRLYSLSVSKGFAMAAFGGWNNEKWVWNFIWRRNLFEWEKQIAKRLFQEVQGVNFDLDKEDRWVWKEGEELGYTVKSPYLRLREDEVGENGTMFKKFWKSKVVPAALVTAWRVLENKLATKANLKRRGITVASSTCSLCGVEEETSTTHLFFECRVAWLLWNHCCAWLGVQRVFPI